jgi:hypothetical protein
MHLPEKKYKYLLLYIIPIILFSVISLSIESWLFLQKYSIFLL